MFMTYISDMDLIKPLDLEDESLHLGIAMSISEEEAKLRKIIVRFL